MHPRLPVPKTNSTTTTTTTNSRTPIQLIAVIKSHRRPKQAAAWQRLQLSHRRSHSRTIRRRRRNLPGGVICTRICTLFKRDQLLLPELRLMREHGRHIGFLLCRSCCTNTPFLTWCPGRNEAAGTMNHRKFPLSWRGGPSISFNSSQNGTLWRNEQILLKSNHFKLWWNSF